MTVTDPPTRKYALRRLAAGDYLLPANDRKAIWRISKYTDGPSQGLEIPRDREFWGAWRLRGKLTDHDDPTEWDAWDLISGMHDTRQAAVDAALTAPEPKKREPSKFAAFLATDPFDKPFPFPWNRDPAAQAEQPATIGDIFRRQNGD